VHLHAGDLHWIANHGCTDAAAIATWPYVTTTVFLFQALQSLPAAAVGLFVSGQLPPVQAGYPIINLLDCKTRCQGAALAANVG
jgi:hypothetical protein